MLGELHANLSRVSYVTFKTTFFVIYFKRHLQVILIFSSLVVYKLNPIVQILSELIALNKDGDIAASH